MNSLTILPAIDIRNGRCVRLTQGRADAEKVYADDPVSVALRWRDDGAKWLHVVDLDGAFARKPVHTDLIGRIASASGLRIEAGGGVRTTEDISRLISAGVRRVVIGTWACQNMEALAGLATAFGDSLAVGIDARDGIVMVKGWTESGGLKAVDLAVAADKAGVQTLVVTDTAVDGMLTGVNAAAMDAVCAAVKCDVIASGGVSSVADIRALRKLRRDNLAGAIVGKALYEGLTNYKDLAKAGSSK